MLQAMEEDLARSGLVFSDIHARPLESPEKAATRVPFNVNGYVIPYYSLYGKTIPFYRVKLFDHEPKYKQPEETPSHVYFPPSFLAHAKSSPYIIITEGEKKAALATKLGFPSVALGGVDAWRNRTISLPADTELNKTKSAVKGKLPSGTQVGEETSGLAVGVQELIDFILLNKKYVIFVYDADEDVGIKPDVQRACANFAFDLRFRGIPFSHIRQLILPPPNIEGPDYYKGKLGLDDYLMKAKAPAFKALVDKCLAKRSAFPRHPSIRDFINKRLQRSNLSRKEMQQLSIGILSDLDANGIRLHNTAEAQTYYFDFVTRKLLKTTFNGKIDDVSDTPFGQFLYRRYGLSGADKRLIIWLAAQFTGEDPIEEVTPHRITGRLDPKDDTVYYQISDAQYVGVSSKGMEIFDNGENGILFEAEQVQPLEPSKLLEQFNSQLAKKATNQWAMVLSRVRLKDQDKARRLTSLLYYVSPWLYRWRGAQLPVELVIGESGSGKSTLCELRLSILTGESRLRNSPTDLKDWHASIANTGGLHVTDNVQLVDKSLRQRLSDEICRIITEPNPHIEMRKYYTNADLMRIPVRSVFALTAIQQPFQNADLIQRAIILELDKTASTNFNEGILYDSEWRNVELQRYGGREGWIAHHCVVLHRFFQLVDAKWDPKYQAKHRLINFEQAIMLMAEVFGEDPKWIPGYLNQIVDRTLQETDWTFEGLKTYVEAMQSSWVTFHKQHNKHYQIKAQSIAEWAEGHEDFRSCEMLISARRLGRYMQIHKALIAQGLGLREGPIVGNRQTYKYEPLKN